jgi:hypothetical protein
MDYLTGELGVETVAEISERVNRIVLNDDDQVIL